MRFMCSTQRRLVGVSREPMLVWAWFYSMMHCVSFWSHGDGVYGDGPCAQGRAPAPRAAHASATLGHRGYICGGRVLVRAQQTLNAFIFFYCFEWINLEVCSNMISIERCSCLVASGNQDERHSLPGPWDLDVVGNVCDSLRLWLTWTSSYCHLLCFSLINTRHKLQKAFSAKLKNNICECLIVFPSVPVAYHTILLIAYVRIQLLLIFQWVLISSIALNMFSRVPASPTPVGRSWHTLTAVSDSSLFLFGGLSTDCKPMSRTLSKKCHSFQLRLTSVILPN